MEVQNATNKSITAIEHITDAAKIPIKIPKASTLSCPVSVHFLKGNAMIAPSKRKTGGNGDEDNQGDQNKDYVAMFMALIRLGDPYNTDIVITLNVPDKITDEDMGSGQQLGETEAFKKYLTSCEKEFKSNLIGSFTIPSDQAVKDLLDL